MLQVTEHDVTNISGTQRRKTMITMGMVDTSYLMMIITWTLLSGILRLKHDIQMSRSMLGQVIVMSVADDSCQWSNLGILQQRPGKYPVELPRNMSRSNYPCSAKQNASHLCKHANLHMLNMKTDIDRVVKFHAEWWNCTHISKAFFVFK